jgi:hypothetical protein
VCGTPHFAHSTCGTIESADGPDTTKESAINVLIHSKKYLARRRRLLLLLLLLVSIGGGWWFFATRPSPQAADLAAARARWQARPFTAYRLTLTLYEPAGPPGGCQQEFVIRDEQVAEVIRDECQRYRNSMTVSDLFTILEPHPEYATSMTIKGFCTVGRECLRVREVQVFYDPVLGYPRTLRVTERLAPNWWHPATWQYILEHGRPPTFVMFGGSFNNHIVVESLTPLPSP